MIKEIIWALVERFCSKIFTVVTFLIIINFLNAESIGLFAAIKLIIDYADTYTDQGLGAVLIQKESPTKTYINTIFWFSLFIGFAVCIVIILIAPLISFLMANKDICLYLYVLSITLIVSGLTRIHVALLIKYLNFRKLALRTSIMSIVGGLTAITLAINDYGVWALVAQQLVSSIIGLFVLWFSVEWKPSFTFDFLCLKEICNNSYKIFLDLQVNFFSIKVDELVILSFLNTEMLGFYNVSKKILQIIIDFLLSTFYKVFLSVLSRLQNDIKVLSNYLLKIIYNVYMIISPVFLSGIVLSDQIVDIFLGHKWFLIVFYLSVFMLSGIFITMPYLLHAAYQAIGMPLIPLKLNALRMFLGFFLFCFSAYYYGLEGVVMAFLLRSVVGFFFDIWFSFVLSLSKREIFFTVIKSVSMSIPLFFYLYLFKGINIFFSGYLNFFFIVFIGVGVYFSTIFCLDRSCLALFIKNSKVGW